MHEKTLGPRRGWYHPLAIWHSVLLRPRVYVSVMASALVLWALPDHLGLSLRCAAAWDVGGMVYLGMAFVTMSRCGSDVIRRKAARQDDSGIVILIIILLAIASSFASIVGLLTEAKAKGASEEMRALLLGLAGLTIAVSWFVTQVAFTFHYAHEHYSPERGHTAGGLAFPGDEHPDYWDFFYFSTSIGASSQTSDTDVKSKGMRRLVTLHAIVSFFFNTTVLALTINLAAGLA